MPDFSRRATATELMETAACSFEDYHACLRDLARVNRLTLAYRPTLNFLDHLAEHDRLPRGRAVRIVDVGCGYGDMLRRIERWAIRRGIAAELTGVDSDPRAGEAAARATPSGRPIRWITADCQSFHPEPPIDIVVSSLFAHHLDDDNIIRFIAWMDRTAAIGWFINDLRRDPVAWLGFGAWSRIARWHRFVRHDGAVSIARAFRRADWRRYLAAAGVPADGATIAGYMPFRLCVARVREP